MWCDNLKIIHWRKAFLVIMSKLKIRVHAMFDGSIFPCTVANPESGPPTTAFDERGFLMRELSLYECSSVLKNKNASQS